MPRAYLCGTESATGVSTCTTTNKWCKKQNLGGPCKTIQTYDLASELTCDTTFVNCCNICQKLRVIVILPKPWTPLPGSEINVASEVNGPPAGHQYPFTTGAPWCVKLASKPAVIPRKVQRRSFESFTDPVYKYKASTRRYDVNEAIYAKYGTALDDAWSFVFDFGNPKVREAHGKLIAYGRGGDVSASISFTYRWCGPQTCGDIILPPFSIDGCTTHNARFVVLGNVNDFLPTDADGSCFLPTVVLGLQQFCCECLLDQVEGIGQELDPSRCVPVGLDCVDSRLLSKCDKP